MSRRPDGYSPSAGSPTPSKPLLTPNASATSSSVSARPIAGGIQRGDIGSAYGPYAFENRDVRRTSVLSNSADSSYSAAPPHAAYVSNEKVTAVARAPGTTAAFGAPVYMWYTNEPEDDDALHEPDEKSSKRGQAVIKQPFVLWSSRGWMNASTLLLLVLALLSLFLVYPVYLTYRNKPFKGPGFNLGNINGSGQVPDLPGMKLLIDNDTPESARSRVGTDGKTYNLVFSDEFTVDGRTFYPGDDAYWEAQDMHYWSTGDLEWYDPSAVTTQGGKLVITFSSNAEHGLNYTSGMLTSWNKFCFTTGYIEVSISLPDAGNVPGFWPGVWTMGNLGRAGYGATTDGMWPYSYDTCDLGTYPGQRDKSGNPQSSASDGWTGEELSDLPGQRVSACTCPGSDHPGPHVSVGRGVPELDVLEAQVDATTGGQVSQSFQIAPFNSHVQFTNSSPETTLYDSSISHFNSFKGTTLQQSVSAVTSVDAANYAGNSYATYGFEYWSDPKARDDGYVVWYSQGVPSWKITSASIGPDSVSQVQQRLISEEPMYIVFNLGMSNSWEVPDFDLITLPAKMYIDYVRVYQREGVGSDGTTCDPPNYPTADYINNHPNAYTNPNWTTWNSAGYDYPRNSQYDGC